MLCELASTKKLYFVGGCMFLDVGDGCVVFHPVFPRWVALNKTGVTLLRACDGRSFGEICSSVYGKGAPSAEILKELEGFFLKMLELGLLAFQPSVVLPSPSLEYAFIHLLDGCNLECSHCYKSSSPRKILFQENRDFSVFFDEFYSLGGKSVVISGGEALLFPGIEEVLASAASRFSVTLATNGTLVTERLAALISSLKIKVQVSLDGSTPEVHDSIRGTGNFAKAVCGIDMLLSNNVDLTLCATVLGQNSHDVLNLVPFAEKRGVSALRFIPLQNAGRASGCKVSLQEFEKTFSDRFYSFLEQYSGPLRISGGCGGLGVFMKEKHPKDYWCTVGSKVVVDADGSVYPCALLMDKAFCLGSLNKDKLADIVSGGKFKSFYDACHSRTESVAECCACVYKGVCQGGCPGHAFQRTGTIFSPDHYCDYRKGVFDKLFSTKILKQS